MLLIVLKIVDVPNSIEGPHWSHAMMSLEMYKRVVRALVCSLDDQLTRRLDQGGIARIDPFDTQARIEMENEFISE